MFNLGLISLEDRGKGEVLFWDVCERADEFAQQKKYVAEEFDDLRQLLSQSIWQTFRFFVRCLTIGLWNNFFRLFRYIDSTKNPTEFATLCDITCDSDGIVEKFVDLHDVKPVLELHKLKRREPYYLAMLLVGAYQEVMGNNHNLFGVPHEAHIHIGEDGHIIKKVISGATLGDALETVRYDRRNYTTNFAESFNKELKPANCRIKDGHQLIEFYENQIDGYTYLSPNGS